jgi:hypothetical protein
MDGYVDIATRRSGSIEVSLLWERAEGKLLVVAHDDLTGDDITIPVDGEHAAEVYRHPFAYAAEASVACARRRRARTAVAD